MKFKEVNAKALIYDVEHDKINNIDVVNLVEVEEWDKLTDDEKAEATAENNKLEAELEAWRESKAYKESHKEVQE